MKRLGFSIEEMRELLAAGDRLAAGRRISKRDGDLLRATLSAYGGRAEIRRAQLSTEVGWAEEFITRMDTLVAGG
ncbi:MAG TPA: hypothetical protein VIG48_06325 [Jatrophihabitans sp.]|jgi:hypothetical protein